MKITINKRKINSAFVALFVLTCILFPADFHNIKKISFIIVLCLNIKPIVQEIINKTLYGWIGLVFPIVVAIVSFIVRGEFSGIINGVYCCTIILLVAPIKYYDIDYKKIFLIAVCIMGIWTLLLFLGDFISLYNINDDTIIRRFIYENNIGVIGKSSSYSFYYKIFIKTCPLIVFLLAYAIDERKYILVFFSLAVIVISGTRANVGFTAIFFILYFLLDKNFSNRKGILILKTITILTVIILVCLYYKQIFKSVINIFVTLSSESDEVRNGHILGMIQLYKEKPLLIITGSGIGSSFYSYSRGNVTTMEWAYLDLLRQVGIVFFLIFMVFVFYPFRRKIPKIYKVAYASYLCIAATNPLLFSSTAFLAYLFIYTIEVRSYKYAIIGTS